jgi:hypothetical protein
MRPCDRNSHGRAEQHRGTEPANGREGIESNWNFHDLARAGLGAAGGKEFLLK